MSKARKKEALLRNVQKPKEKVDTTGFEPATYRCQTECKADVVTTPPRAQLCRAYGTFGYISVHKQPMRRLHRSALCLPMLSRRSRSYAYQPRVTFFHRANM